MSHKIEKLKAEKFKWK